MNWGFDDMKDEYFLGNDEMMSLYNLSRCEDYEQCERYYA
jgi:hypothetical protein